ncbi:MAG TPA: protein kinase [Ktedonobacteraceae bacterium]|nr:protein kinase [Ktedonobacteraceae bacterium]
MNVETRDISVSFDQPSRTLNALRTALEQTADASTAHTGRLPVPSHDGRQVVIVDSVSERAQFIARLVSVAGYRPFVAGSALDAFTAFLQGSIIPVVIIISSEDAADSLFFLRLQQRVYQKYHRDVPFIRVHTIASSKTNSSSPGPTTAGPLPPPQASRHIQPERIVRPEARSTPGTVTPRPQFASPVPGSTPRGTTGPLQLPPPSPASRVPNEGRSGSLRRIRTEPLPPVRTIPLPPPSMNTPLPAISKPATSPVPAMPSAPLSMPGMVALQTLPGPIEHETIVEIKEVEKKNLEGQNLGRYQIMNPLGSSPLGDAYIVYDRLRETSIAFKSIQGNVLPDGFLEDAYINTNLFQQEVDMLAKLKHPHILRVLNAGKSYISGTPFYYKTMPHCQEGSLAGWLYEHNTTGPFSLQDVLPVALQLAEALQFAHDAGVLYQNFKLTNFLLDGTASDNIRNLRVLLADFALTGDNKHLLRTPQTLRYLAPEQWGGESLPASDQYGLAAILYELLTGRPPFQGHQEHLLKHMHLTMQSQPPSAFNPGLSFAADAAVLRALSKNPQDRFSSITDFALALRTAF